MANIPDIIKEDARIIFRNFGGNRDKYNPAGQRNFGLIISPADAEALIEEGWHIKYLKPREEGDEPQPYLPVKVSYAKKPPVIYLVTESRGKRKKTALGEDDIKILDNAEFKNIDLDISPYPWTFIGKNGMESGITAYLKTGYFTIVSDVFADKYDSEDLVWPNRDEEDEDEIPFS